LIVDVQFGDEDLQVELFDFLQKFRELSKRGRAFVGAQVRLDAEGMERYAFALEATQESEDRLAFLLLIVSIGFDVEVVVGEERVGVGVGSGAISQLNVTFADLGEPNGSGQIVVIVMLGADGFVDDVPGVDTALAAGDDGANVIGEDLCSVLRSDGLFEPGRVMFVPAEIVAAHEEMIGFGEVSEEIGLREVEAVGLWMRGSPLHLIFRDKDGALVEEERSEVEAMELRIGDGGAEKERAGERKVAEAGDRRGRLLLRLRGSGDGPQRELQELAAVHGRKRIDGFAEDVIECRVAEGSRGGAGGVDLAHDVYKNGCAQA